MPEKRSAEYSKPDGGCKRYFALFERQPYDRPSLATPGPPTSSIGATSPAPDQTTLRPRRQLERLCHSQIFHPKNHAVPGLGHNQIAPPRPWNFPVREQILKLDCRLQADRLKPVSRPPVTQHNLSSNLVRVKKFAAGFLI